MSDDAKLHSEQLPKTFKWKPEARDARDVKGGKIKVADDTGTTEFDVQLAFKMLEDPTHPEWAQLFKSSVGGTEQKFSRVAGWVRRLDGYTRKHLDAQLEGYLPDVRERIVAAFGKKDVDRKSFDRFMDSLAAPREMRKLEGQLPAPLVDYFRMQRKKYGIHTDDAPIGKIQKDELFGLAAGLKLEHKHLKQLAKVLWDDSEIKTAGQADQMIGLLRGETGLLSNGEMEKVTFRFTPNRFNPLAKAQDVDEAGLPFLALGEAPKDSFTTDSVARGVVPPTVMSAGDRSLPFKVPTPTSDTLEAGAKTATNQAGEHLPNNIASAQARIKDLEQEMEGAKRAVDGTKTRKGLKAKYDTAVKSHKETVALLKEARAEYKAHPSDLLEERKNRLNKLAKQNRLKVTEAGKTYREAKAAVGDNAKRQQGTGKYVRDLKDRLRQEKTSLRQLERKLREAGNRPAGEYKGGGLTKDPKMPSTHAVGVDVFVDQGTAKLLKELMEPTLDPTLGAVAKRAVLGFDKLTNLFKTNLLLPWTGTWGRNALSNVAINYLKGGLGVFHPKRGADYQASLYYILGKHSDMGKRLSPEKIEEMGMHVITAANGRMATVKELVEEMSKRGVFKASITDDVLSGTSGWKRFSGVVGGAGAGSMVGALASAPFDNEPEGGWFAPQNITSLLGLVAGAYLGGRKATALNQKGVTGVLQNGWKPMLRTGEMATEIPMRMAMFIHGFAESGSVTEAANGVYRHLNDWNSLGTIEKRYIRRAIPFYNWTKLAVRQTFYTAMENPGRLSTMLKVPRDWNESEHVDPEDVPDFLHEKLTFVGNFLGEKWALSGLGAPVEDVADLAGALLPGTLNASKEIKELSGGIIRRGAFGAASAIAALTNTDTFTGDKIASDVDQGVYITRFQDGKSWGAAPEWLKTLVGYRPAQTSEKGSVLANAVVNPHMAWLLGEIPVSRFLNLTKQVYESDDPKALNYSALARAFLGAAAYRHDPKTGSYFKNKRRIEKMKSLLVHVGALRTYQGFVDTTKKDKDFSVGRR